MRLGDAILLTLSRAPEAEDRGRADDAWDLATALSLLQAVYPPIVSEIAGKAVLDFGCGFGWQVLAMASCGAKRAAGVDSDATILADARELVNRVGTGGATIEFHEKLEPELYGSHMRFFTKVPWVNLWFSEKTVMNVRRRFRSDLATRYEEVKRGLNKMTLRRFERIVDVCGLRLIYWKLECVKGLDWLGHVPVIREFCVNHVTCMLAQAERRCVDRVRRRPQSVR